MWTIKFLFWVYFLPHPEGQLAIHTPHAVPERLTLLQFRQVHWNGLKQGGTSCFLELPNPLRVSSGVLPFSEPLSYMSTS